MLKNCVFRADVDTIQWVKAAGIRAVKTMAQTFVATIGSAAVMGEVNWPMVASASALQVSCQWQHPLQAFRNCQPRPERR